MTPTDDRNEDGYPRMIGSAFVIHHHDGRRSPLQQGIDALRTHLEAAAISEVRARRKAAWVRRGKRFLRMFVGLGVVALLVMIAWNHGPAAFMGLGTWDYGTALACTGGSALAAWLLSLAWQLGEDAAYRGTF